MTIISLMIGVMRASHISILILNLVQFQTTILRCSIMADACIHSAYHL